MKIKGPLIPATFLSRPNRFLTIVRINGVKHKSHLPDPGRLNEILKVGVKVYVRPEPISSSRKTRFTTILVEHQNLLISLVTTLPAPIKEFCIIVIPQTIVLFAPIETESSTLVFTNRSSPQPSTLGYKSFVNTTEGPIYTSFPIVTPLYIETLF